MFSIFGIRKRLPYVALSLINSVLALSAVYVLGSYSSIRYISIASFLIFGALLISHKGNILFLARTLFLGGIGYYPMFIKALFGPDTMFAFYETSTQAFDIVSIMYVGTSLALLGNELGLYLGESKFTTNQPESALWRTIYHVSIPVVVLVSVLTARLAPNVFVAAYASESKSQLLGNTQCIGVICLLAVFVASEKLKLRYGRYVTIGLAILLLVWAMFLRGMRQDVVTALLGFAVCSALVQGKEYSVTLRKILIVFGVVVAVEFMGIVRAYAFEGYGFSELWSMFRETAFVNQDVYSFGTVSPIAITYANIVHLIDSATMPMLYGKSFLEFIPRTPPEFLYPDRPMDYAWIFPYYGLRAGGGIFELAESYMNFGLVGTLIVPFCISFFLSRYFYKALWSQSTLGYFLLFSFLGVFLRGTWYQIFAFYKSFLTAVILFMVFRSIHSVFGRAGVMAVARKN